MVLDEHADVLLSTKVDNDERALLELISTVAGIAAGAASVCWATDLNAGGAAMLIALLTAHDQHLLYLPGRIVHHAAVTYRGEKDRRQGRANHRRSGSDAHRSAAGPAV